MFLSQTIDPNDHSLVFTCTVYQRDLDNLSLKDMVLLNAVCSEPDLELQLHLLLILTRRILRTKEKTESVQ